MLLCFYLLINIFSIIYIQSRLSCEVFKLVYMYVSVAIFIFFLLNNIWFFVKEYFKLFDKDRFKRTAYLRVKVWCRVNVRWVLNFLFLNTIIKLMFAVKTFNITKQKWKWHPCPGTPKFKCNFVTNIVIFVFVGNIVIADESTISQRANALVSCYMQPILTKASP